MDNALFNDIDNIKNIETTEYEKKGKNQVQNNQDHSIIFKDSLQDHNIVFILILSWLKKILCQGSLILKNNTP